MEGQGGHRDGGGACGDKRHRTSSSSEERAMWAHDAMWEPDARVSSIMAAVYGDRISTVASSHTTTSYLASRGML